MKIVLFEDQTFKNFLPIVYFRPVWEIRCGAKLLEEKIANFFPDTEIYYSAREYLEKYYLREERLLNRISEDEEVLFLNGRTVLNKKNFDELKSLENNSGITASSNLIALRTTVKNIKQHITQGILDTDKLLETSKSINFKASKTKFTCLNYIWDAVTINGDEILNDRDNFGIEANAEISKVDGVYMIKPENIFLGKDVSIKPCVVLDASNGPIWIDDHVTIMSQSTLEGPLHIGSGSKIKIGAKIYENTTIGPVCKVGGEVEASIIHSYSNKQHDGFLGHSYLGSWVNIGGGATTSDLKNTYGDITVKLNGTDINTGLMNLGSIIGDHSKIGIETACNTGTIIGTNSNVFNHIPGKFVPSFSWGGEEYKLHKAIEVAEKVMIRRNVELGEKGKELFRTVKTLAQEVEN